MLSDVVNEKTHADLTCICLDARHRKFYVGDAQGSIRVFNISNGVYVKSVTKDNTELNPLKQKKLKPKAN